MQVVPSEYPQRGFPSSSSAFMLLPLRSHLLDADIFCPSFTHFSKSSIWLVVLSPYKEKRLWLCFCDLNTTYLLAASNGPVTVANPTLGTYNDNGVWPKPSRPSVRTRHLNVRANRFDRAFHSDIELGRSTAKHSFWDTIHLAGSFSFAVLCNADRRLRLQHPGRLDRNTRYQRQRNRDKPAPLSKQYLPSVIEARLSRYLGLL